MSCARCKSVTQTCQPCVAGVLFQGFAGFSGVRRLVWYMDESHGSCNPHVNPLLAGMHMAAWIASGSDTLMQVGAAAAIANEIVSAAPSTIMLTRATASAGTTYCNPGPRKPHDKSRCCVN